MYCIAFEGQCSGFCINGQNCVPLDSKAITKNSQCGCSTCVYNEISKNCSGSCGATNTRCKVVYAEQTYVDEARDLEYTVTKAYCTCL